MIPKVTLQQIKDTHKKEANVSHTNTKGISSYDCKGEKK